MDETQKKRTVTDAGVFHRGRTMDNSTVTSHLGASTMCCSQMLMSLTTDMFDDSDEGTLKKEKYV